MTVLTYIIVNERRMKKKGIERVKDENLYGKEKILKREYKL